MDCFFDEEIIIFSIPELFAKKLCRSPLILFWKSFTAISIPSLYLFFTLISYRVLGIPLFGESRLDSYSGSGLGFIYRIQPFLLTYSTIYIYYSWDSLTVSKSKKINLTINLTHFKQKLQHYDVFFRIFAALVFHWLLKIVVL